MPTLNERSTISGSIKFDELSGSGSMYAPSGSISGSMTFCSGS